MTPVVNYSHSTGSTKDPLINSTQPNTPEATHADQKTSSVALKIFKFIAGLPLALVLLPFRVTQLLINPISDPICQTVFKMEHSGPLKISLKVLAVIVTLPLFAICFLSIHQKKSVDFALDRQPFPEFKLPPKSVKWDEPAEEVISTRHGLLDAGRLSEDEEDYYRYTQSDTQPVKIANRESTLPNGQHTFAQYGDSPGLYQLLSSSPSFDESSDDPVDF